MSLQEPLAEEEIEELLAEFLEVESKVYYFFTGFSFCSYEFVHVYPQMFYLYIGIYRRSKPFFFFFKKNS